MRGEYNFSRMLKEGFHGKVMFDVKLEGGEEVNHAALWEKNIPGRRISQAEVLTGQQAWPV